MERHVSVRVGATYVSWRPGCHEDCISKIAENERACRIHVHSFRDDIAAEDGLPLRTLDLSGLDEGMASAWWKGASAPAQCLTTLGRTCATTVARVLMVAGGEDYTSLAAGMRNPWRFAWRSMVAHRLTEEIAAGIRAGGEQRRAINFVRRFQRPVLTSTGVSIHVLNAREVALAMHEQLSGKAELICEIFHVLRRRGSGVAFDVAWRYVKRTAGSRAGMRSLLRSRRLVHLLLETLYEDPTMDESVDAIRSLTPLRTSEGLGIDPDYRDPMY